MSLIKTKLFLLLQKVVNWYRGREIDQQIRSFGSVGCNFQMHSIGIFKGSKNVYIGDNVIFSDHVQLLTTNAKITFGNGCMIGAYTTMITGNHRTDLVGKYMIDIDEKTEKLPDNDADIRIEDDVWMGVNVIILKGVTVGTGSVIAAGAIVTRDVPPYSIYISRNKIIPRFSPENERLHKQMIEERYGK